MSINSTGPHGGPPLPTEPLPFRSIGDKRGRGILREPRCPHLHGGNPAGCSACTQERDNGVDPFSGYGLALRAKDDPPIPGEPLMSMADARRIHAEQVDALRRALAESDEQLENVLRYLAEDGPAIVDGSPQGRDGEARLDAKHDSDGANGNRPTSVTLTQEGKR